MTHPTIKFGRYKGEKLDNVPAKYLLALYEKQAQLDQDIVDYIRENMDALQMEIGKIDLMEEEEYEGEG